MSGGAERIDAAMFSGHRGYVVDDQTGAIRGELDAQDTVRRLTRDGGLRGLVDEGDELGPPVAWDDATHVAARADFIEKRALLQQTRQQITGVSAALKVPETRRPPEHELTEPLAQAAAVFDSDAAPALRADAANLVAWGEILVADNYVFALNLVQRIRRGRRAYSVQREATQLDPSNDEAWFNYGLFVLGVYASPYRDLAGVSYPREFEATAKGLARFSGNARAQVVLEALLATAHNGGVSFVGRDALHTEVRGRLPKLRAAQPDGTAEADLMLTRIRGAIERTPRGG